MRLHTDTHILVIEDEPDLLANLCASLRDENYEVEGVNCGKSGFNRAVAHCFDLIILDMMLPELSGLDLLKELRKHKNTPVILLTAIDDIENKMECFNLEADDYITKPFHLKELKARIANTLKKYREQRPYSIHLNDITIDTLKRSVSKNGAAIPITHREYTIIEYLALHRGKVVNRDILHDLFFDDAEDTLSNVLDVNISTLRKKLGKGLIQTKRGIGYFIP